MLNALTACEYYPRRLFACPPFKSFSAFVTLPKLTVWPRKQKSGNIWSHWRVMERTRWFFIGPLFFTLPGAAR